MALSAMDEVKAIDSVVAADSSAATTVEEAAATGEGSAQPEGLRSAESPLPPGVPPDMEGPPGIDVKEEAKEDGSTVETDGSTVAGVNIEATAEAASGHVSNEEQALAEKHAHWSNWSWRWQRNSSSSRNTLSSSRKTLSWR